MGGRVKPPALRVEGVLIAIPDSDSISVKRCCNFRAGKLIIPQVFNRLNFGFVAYCAPKSTIFIFTVKLLISAEISAQWRKKYRG